MGQLTKNQKAYAEKVDVDKVYSLAEATALVKECSNVKFDATVDIAVRLGIDPRKANQMVRGTVSLPHGTGKSVRVLVLCNPDKEQRQRTLVRISLDSTSTLTRSREAGPTLM